MARSRTRSIGTLAGDLPSCGTLRRGADMSPTVPAEPRTLEIVGNEFARGREETVRHRVRIPGGRLNLVLDRGLARWRERGGAAVFELLAGGLAADKAAPGLLEHLGRSAPPLPIVLLDRSRHLVEVHPRGELIGLNRAALAMTGLSPGACLVAAALAHGLRAAARHRSGDGYDLEKERRRDVQILLVLLVGVIGTEWRPDRVREEFRLLLDPRDPLLAEFEKYAEKLKGTLSRRDTTVLDDRVFRDGALFDRLPGREKLRVVLAGTLAWYGLLSLGLLRLPRKFFARRNPYYETAWWIFRARPGGRRLWKTKLLRRGLKRLRSLRVLSAFELIWSSWNATLAVTCLRPVYRSAGGNHRPFRATMATFAYTALVIHPLWITLMITGLAWCLGLFWPWLAENTRIASVENLILHAIVIGFWIGVGLIVATSKAVRRALTSS